MKKGINLVTKQKKYLRYEAFFRNTRLALFIISIIALFVSVGFFTVIIERNAQLQKRLSQKKQLLEYLAENKEVEAEFIYFRNKQKRLVSILEQDVKFLPYYNLITQSLKIASPEPKLDTIIITKDRAINFTLSFDDSKSMVLFLKSAETDEFLKNFSQLIISRFSIESQKTRTNANYKLNLAGKLNPLNEN